jgi:hypothetical protein
MNSVLPANVGFNSMSALRLRLRSYSLFATCGSL